MFTLDFTQTVEKYYSYKLDNAFNINDLFLYY